MSENITPYEQGWIAASNGEQKVNPHGFGTAPWAEWEEGWDDERMAVIDAQQMGPRS